MRRGMLFAAAALGVGTAFALPGIVAAQTPTQDSVIADAPDISDPFFSNLQIDAHSGPSGENPTGTASFDVHVMGQVGTLSGSVTCLAVRGRTATLVVPTEPIGFTKIQVVDNRGTAVPDTFTAGPFEENPGCAPLTSGETLTMLSGDITVVDAPAKRVLFTHRECKLGGWARIGFKSRRQCDNFVRWQCSPAQHANYGFPTRAVCRIVINRT